ncbi:hypothetical protein [Roseimaritima ulvae]|uniref:Uncharacterized protein n=1 Tax=Roseimaritima ulvae TaxID=980254 RepID=A0A5B9QMK2_9BACT|nr:hypothetical protein [Roseimaritima ulvae]QEG40317.1 hypothetical protein UC8_23240 [Roseimaritima ulvae]
MSAEGQETPSSKWRENHGNILLGFVALVLVVGAGLVIYRQNSAHSSTAPPNVPSQALPVSAGDDEPDQAASEDDPTATTGDPENTGESATTSDSATAGDPKDGEEPAEAAPTTEEAGDAEPQAAGALRPYDVV